MLRWLLLIFAVFAIFKLLTSPGTRTRQTRSSAEPKGAETVVACVRCGVFLPSSEALLDDAGRTFCCESHRHDGVKR
jgi:hypothetical protein